MNQHAEPFGELAPALVEAVQRGVELLRAGELVAYPTDTLYGLGCDPWNRLALRRLFEAKGRPPSQALPLLLADEQALSSVAGPLPPAVLELARRFWPGALTLVAPSLDSVPPEVTGGGRTVAVRLPDHPVPRRLAAGLDGAIAGTSANRSGGPDPVQASQVREQLGEQVNLVIDGGACLGAQGSTILDVTGPRWKVLREGPVTAERLRQAGFGAFLEER